MASGSGRGGRDRRTAKGRTKAKERRKRRKGKKRDSTAELYPDLPF